MEETIGGTVIQRSFVGRGVANIIHIATVPSDDLGVTDMAFENVLAELLGIPRESILTDHDYTRVLHHLGSFLPDYFLHFWIPRTSREYLRWVEKLPSETSTKAFIGDFISLISSPPMTPSILSYLLPFMQERITSSFEMHDDAFHLALACLSSRLHQRDHVRAFYDRMLTYDIPLGQSPETNSENLLKLLETSKKVCVAPLAIGGAQGINLLAQGNYVGALLTTGTAGVMTLLLIGTISVSSIIVQRVAQRRTSHTQRSSRDVRGPSRAMKGSSKNVL